jgi:hypothetical protein
MRYVSIRHGGQKLSPDKEINGLSLGGVGRGTTLEYIEVLSFADDGFEFFGGSVNTKYLVSAFNDDDSFDTDMGWSGKNQFWFAIQSNDKRDTGSEQNGEPTNGMTGREFRRQPTRSTTRRCWVPGPPQAGRPTITVCCFVGTTKAPGSIASWKTSTANR